MQYKISEFIKAGIICDFDDTVGYNCYMIREDGVWLLKSYNDDSKRNEEKITDESYSPLVFMQMIFDFDFGAW